MNHIQKKSMDVITYPYPDSSYTMFEHDDVIKWKHFPRYWPFVRAIHRSPVNSPRKGQWLEALIFSFKSFFLSTPEINGSVNNRKAGDLRRHRAHYHVTVMQRDPCDIEKYILSQRMCSRFCCVFCCCINHPSRSMYALICTYHPELHKGSNHDWYG